MADIEEYTAYAQNLKSIGRTMTGFHFFVWACPLMTFLTIFASSIKNARTTLFLK